MSHLSDSMRPVVWIRSMALRILPPPPKDSYGDRGMQSNQSAAMDKTIGFCEHETAGQNHQIILDDVSGCVEGVG